MVYFPPVQHVQLVKYIYLTNSIFGITLSKLSINSSTFGGLGPIWDLNPHSESETPNCPYTNQQSICLYIFLNNLIAVNGHNNLAAVI